MNNGPNTFRKSVSQIFIKYFYNIRISYPHRTSYNQINRAETYLQGAPYFGHLFRNILGIFYGNMFSIKIYYAHPTTKLPEQKHL